MNDPNGLVYYKGVYHLFYQYNPEGEVWDHISWGHATSTDLMKWIHRPIAIRGAAKEMVFSGSVVVDYLNTSGLGSTEDPALVAIYTEFNVQSRIQTQCLAFSIDEGITWNKYAGNPVLDINSKEFRDPKVFWDEVENRWLMAIALAAEQKIRFYESSNLKNWNHLSDFGPLGEVGGVWECPDFFQLHVNGNEAESKWILIVSINPGGLYGGSGTQYFIGDWDGKVFTVTESPTKTKWLDFGKDYYAAVSFYNVPDNRRIMLGWMSNWQYQSELPTSPFRGQMSIPREMRLEKIDQNFLLAALPVRELSPAKIATISVETFLDISFDFTPATSGVSGLRISRGGLEYIDIFYDPETQNVILDRNTSSSPSVQKLLYGEHLAPARLIEDRLTFRVIIDVLSVELFINGGEQVITDLILSSEIDKNEVQILGDQSSLIVHKLEIRSML